MAGPNGSPLNISTFKGRIKMRIVGSSQGKKSRNEWAKLERQNRGRHSGVKI